jgi:hypothetical protein
MDQQGLERIRLLSSRFHELQGLRVALAGTAIIIAVGGYLIAAPVPTNNGAMVALATSFVLMGPGLWWLNRYYAATFGRQVWKPGRFTKLFLPAYFLVAWLVNASIPAIPAGAPTVATVVAVSAWVAIRDWPWRAYYLAPPVAVAIAFTFTASGGGDINPHLTLAILFLTLGASFVPIGMLDHMLLVKLMNEVRAPESTTAADRSN